MAIKLDIEKAYDRLDWTFIKKFFLDVCFSGKWTKFGHEMYKNHFFDNAYYLMGRLLIPSTFKGAFDKGTQFHNVHA